MKIVAFEIEPHEAEAFKNLEAEHELVLVDEPLDADRAAQHADADILSVFIYSKLDRTVLERLTALKMIATRSTGYDHIDTGYCAERNIIVANVPSYGENTVAEHVFALLLALSHRIPEAMDKARKGPFSPEGLQGFDLKGKTLGVIGTGHIGRHVIRIAKGFGMAVMAYDVYPNVAFADQMGFDYAALNDVLSASDILTLHLPATASTQHFLGSDEFARMKDGVVLINTARGDLIDSRALIEALVSGKVSAAGLDVLPDEPFIREEAELICSIYCDQHDLRNLVADHVLLRMSNVIVTPHSAFNTREAVQRIVDTTIDNIESFVAGKPLNAIKT